MAKDKSGKSGIKAGVLTLTDEELETAEQRKDWVGGGSGLPELGEHDGVISIFEPTEKQGGTGTTAGSDKFRIEVTLDEGGARLNEWPIAHSSVAGRMMKVLEVTGLKRIERNAEGKNELVLPNKAECATAVGTRVRVKVTGYEGQYRDRDKPKDEQRQQAIWGFVSALGAAGKASKNGKATAASATATGGKDKGAKQKIAR